VGVSGFCYGGRITWLYAAHQPRLRAGVAWYGRLLGPHTAQQPAHPIERVAVLQAPVLGLYGGQDAGIPVASVARMQAALRGGSAAAQRSEFVLYRQAPHAFFADYRPSYREADARDAWARCLAWLQRHGV
jgi:carboxymethylenebutenolidase